VHPSVTAAVVSVSAVALLGVWVTVAGPRMAAPSWYVRAGSRVRSAVDGCVSSVGRVATSAVVILAGFAATILSCYALGKGAHALENVLDWPVFAWFRARQLPGAWTDAWTILTQMGNRSRTQPLTLAAALVLAVLWARTGRRWLVPLLLLPIGYLFEKYGQMFLKLAVHRGHPPTTLGTWPSGGCARLVVVFGLVIYLALRWKGASRRTWLGSWTVLALLAAIEAYSRTYLLKHWVTDVLGGLVYGSMVLAVMVATVAVLDRDGPRATDVDVDAADLDAANLDAADVTGVRAAKPDGDAALGPAPRGDRPRSAVGAGLRTS